MLPQRMTDLQTTITTLTLDQLVTMWLHNVFMSKSKSQKTQRAYRDTIAGYRHICHSSGLDLDSSDTRTLANLAQGYAAYSTGRRASVSSATIAQRLAILSSFYLFAVKRGYMSSNPIALIDRPAVQAYAQATPLAATAPNLAQIDRTSASGKRDYALLSLLLSTGRRASEIANLTSSDIDISPQAVTITSTAKGGKIMHDTLATSVARAVRDYLDSVYPDGLPDNAPIFVSFSKRNKGQRITTQTVADICQRYLGTSKVHATRHTFAATMERAGAPLSTIQDRLGHANAATTSRYLHALSSGSNPYIDQLVAAMGID